MGVPKMWILGRRGQRKKRFPKSLFHKKIYIRRKKTDSERVPWGKDWKRLGDAGGKTCNLIKIWKEPVNPI